MKLNARLARPAIFGGYDGASSLLGVVVFLLLTHPALIFPAALSGAISSAISMGGGEWLSDSDSGFGASSVMAGATFTGALLPGIPFAFGHGMLSIAFSAVLVVMVAVVVAFLRTARSRTLALAETLGLTVLIFAVTLLCGWLLPGSAG